MAGIAQVVLSPILVKNGKIGTYQGYKDYGMQYCTILDENGKIIMTGMTPSGDRVYPDLTGALNSNGYIGHEMPIVRDNPDVALDPTGNYPGSY